MNISIPDDVKKIMATLINHGFESYIVGGYVRDMIIGVPSKDIDLFTNATGDEIRSLFPDSKVIGGEERQNKILTTIVGDNIELSSYRANGDRTETCATLAQHLSTCDFYMNAIAINIDGFVTDPYWGTSDIKDEMINAVGSAYKRINEDKLRAFRAVRFAVKYNFDISLNLINCIKNTSVTDIPIERIREEVLKILTYPNGLKTLQDLGLLTKVIREFWYNINLNGGHHHGETVDVHMRNAQNAACSVTDNVDLIFACAMHDIGKGVSYQVKEDGSFSFHEHEHIGADMIHDIMERMKFSNSSIRYVTALVRNHLLNYDEKTTDKAYVRLFKRLEDGGVPIGDYMVMLYADNQGNMKNERVKFGDFVNGNKILEKYYELKFSSMPFGLKDLNITGFDLMDAGILNGPQIGRVLDELFEMVISGKVENRFDKLFETVVNNRLKIIGEE